MPPHANPLSGERKCKIAKCWCHERNTGYEFTENQSGSCNMKQATCWVLMFFDVEDRSQQNSDRSLHSCLLLWLYYSIHSGKSWVQICQLMGMHILGNIIHSVGTLCMNDSLSATHLHTHAFQRSFLSVPACVLFIVCEGRGHQRRAIL